MERKALCVVDSDEDNRMAVLGVCGDSSIFGDVMIFSDIEEARTGLDPYSLGLAVISLDDGAESALSFAESVKRQNPACALIFTSSKSDYALEAFRIHATGYVLRPITADRMKREMDYLLSLWHSRAVKSVRIQTFGNFEIIKDGRAVSFSRSKAKELMAYLVDKNGSGVTRAEIFAVLWDSGVYDRSMQKQVDVIIRSLRDTLQRNGISDILEHQHGNLRIRTEHVDCDLYRFLKGDPEAIRSFRGEYMGAYSWATITEAHLEQSAFGSKP